MHATLGAHIVADEDRSTWFGVSSLVVSSNGRVQRSVQGLRGRAK